MRRLLCGATTAVRRVRSCAPYQGLCLATTRARCKGVLRSCSTPSSLHAAPFCSWWVCAGLPWAMPAKLSSASLPRPRLCRHRPRPLAAVDRILQLPQRGQHAAHDALAERRLQRDDADTAAAAGRAAARLLRRSGVGRREAGRASGLARTSGPQRHAGAGARRPRLPPG